MASSLKPILILTDTSNIGIMLEQLLVDHQQKH